MKKPDQHGVFKNTESHWSCNFGECDEKADFIIVEVFGQEEERQGACKKHAREWAEKDNCESCLKRINE